MLTLQRTSLANVPKPPPVSPLRHRSLPLLGVSGNVILTSVKGASPSFPGHTRLTLMHDITVYTDEPHAYLSQSMFLGDRFRISSDLFSVGTALLRPLYPEVRK